jgi:hypothetical protein
MDDPMQLTERAVEPYGGRCRLRDMSSRRSALVVAAVLLALSGCSHRATLPRSTDVVDVTWSQPRLPSGEALGTAGHRHLTGAAATKVVDWLNGLPPWRGPNHCDACPFPLFYEAEPVFTFHVKAGTAVYAYKDDFEVDVTIDGRRQRTLSALSALSTLATPDSETLTRDVLPVTPPAS